MTQARRRRFLLRALLDENRDFRGRRIPTDAESQWLMLRGLMNIREADPVSDDFLAVQDEYLKEEIASKGITDVDDLTPLQPGLYLWQGDITTLRCDAIVNAANSGMTGCYAPNHRCIDNAIHTFAGVQLRRACDCMMAAQGHPEPTGQAKITPAFNLPCRYVLHTVGPIIQGDVTEKDKELLASCYRACLTLAADIQLESVAFCCISTGEFHFPNELAAEIALQTVREFMTQQTSIKKVIFNVFKDTDKDIYTRLLRAD
ncbi:MAG: protein-ADP-ribose hydrolase [Clostridia bacterium]|nr:protein-ADP-ribose hydrolase [Clostridia bacterium]